MARTAIPVQTVAAFQEGLNPITATSGDAVNDHSIDGTYAPKLMLIAFNNNVAAVAFTVELASGDSSYSETVSIAQSVQGIGHEAMLLDVPADMLQTGALIHIDSADANFADMRFYAYTWDSTPLND